MDQYTKFQKELALNREHGSVIQRVSAQMEVEIVGIELREQCLKFIYWKNINFNQMHIDS